MKNDISDKRLKAKQIEFEKSFQVNVKVLNPICIGCCYGNEQLTAKSLQILTSYQVSDYTVTMTTDLFMFLVEFSL